VTAEVGEGTLRIRDESGALLLVIEDEGLVRDAHGGGVARLSEDARAIMLSSSTQEQEMLVADGVELEGNRIIVQLGAGGTVFEVKDDALILNGEPWGTIEGYTASDLDKRRLAAGLLIIPLLPTDQGTTTPVRDSSPAEPPPPPPPQPRR
jgi:hypothetical protein